MLGTGERGLPHTGDDLVCCDPKPAADAHGTPMQSPDEGRTTPGLSLPVWALPAASCGATSGSDAPPGLAARPGAGRPAADRRRSGRHAPHRPALALGRKRGSAR